MESRLTVGSLLGDMRGLLGMAAGPSAIYLILLSVVGTLLDLNSDVTSGYFFINSIVSLVGGYLLLRAIVLAAGLVEPGEVGGFWPYFGMSFLQGIAILLGFLLLIVPGVLLMVRWTPAFALLLCDKPGVTEAMGQSWKRTEGHFWPLFGAGLIGSVAALGSVIWISVIWVDVDFASPVGMAVTGVTNIIVSAMSVYFALLGVAAYRQLFRSDADMAEIFA